MGEEIDKEAVVDEEAPNAAIEAKKKLRSHLLLFDDYLNVPTEGECPKCGALYTKTLYANKCAKLDRAIAREAQNLSKSPKGENAVA